MEQINKTENGGMKKIIDRVTARKNLMVLVVVILAAEVVWAVWTLAKPVKQVVPVRNVTSTSSVEKPSSPTTAFLQASKTSVAVGEKVTVKLILSSAQQTDGTDLIVLYDPKLLAIDPAAKKTPVAVGTIYGEYPINSVDEKVGRIAVSGITSLPGGVIPNGLFGTINFVAKASGNTTVSLDFVSGSTSDSNVVETKSAKDILDEVKNVELVIVP